MLVVQRQYHAVLQSRLMKQVNFLENYERLRKTYLKRFERQDLKAGVFNLLSSRSNLHLSCNPAGRSHCRLQNHHGYIKHHHRGMGGSPGDVGEVPLT